MESIKEKKGADYTVSKNDKELQDILDLVDTCNEAPKYLERIMPSVDWKSVVQHSFDLLAMSAECVHSTNQLHPSLTEKGSIASGNDACLSHCISMVSEHLRCKDAFMQYSRDTPLYLEGEPTR